MKPSHTPSDPSRPPATSADPVSGAASGADDRILAIDMQGVSPDALPAGVVGTASFGDLDADLLARLRPSHVMLPLMSRGHDATAVIERLETLGFAGRITVVALKLPNAPMVQQELRSLGPGLRLTLLMP